MWLPRERDEGGGHMLPAGRPDLGLAEYVAAGTNSFVRMDYHSDARWRNVPHMGDKRPSVNEVPAARHFRQPPFWRRDPTGHALRWRDDGGGTHRRAGDPQRERIRAMSRRKSLVNTVADDLLDRVIAGDFGPGDPLPSEAELGDQFDVSRVTVREALRTLSARGIVRVLSGVGSRIAPVEEWRSVPDALRYRAAHGDDATVSVQLISTRRLIECEAAALAAPLISDAALDECDECVDAMVAASTDGDVDAFVAADLRFHGVILEASGNLFLAVLLAPLTEVLAERRTQTSRVPEIQEHAIEEHRAIVTALRSRDGDEARAAMDHHLQQTLDDLREYVLR